MLHWTDSLNASSPRWIELAWAIVWQSTLVASFVAIVAKLVPRSAPTWRHWLWQLVAIKLLLMPIWTAPWTPPTPVIKAALGPTTEVPSMVRLDETRTRVAPTRHASAHPRHADRIASATGRVARTAAARSSAARTTTPGVLTWQSWLWLTWLAVVAAQLLRWGWLRIQLERLLRRAVPARTAIAELVDQLSKETGLRRVPAVLLTTDDISPLTCRIWRPVLVLPHELIETLKPVQLRQVLLHELAHLRRGDLIWGWLPELARLVYFFHPLVHWLSYFIRLERELACDQWAMSLSGRALRDYLETLVSVVGHVSRPSVLRAPQLSTFWKRRMAMLPFVYRSEKSTRVGRHTCVLFAAATLVVAIPTFYPNRTAGQDEPTSRGPTTAASNGDVRLSNLEREVARIREELAALRNVEESRGEETAETPDFEDEAAGEMDEGEGEELDDECRELDEQEMPEEAVAEEADETPADMELGDANEEADDGPIFDGENDDIGIHAKAEALAGILSQHLNADAIQVRVEGNQIIITVDPAEAFTNLDRSSLEGDSTDAELDDRADDGIDRESHQINDER
jgi:beta-lactamase regulating signal transducer with metallopeptidase domain